MAKRISKNKNSHTHRDVVISLTILMFLLMPLISIFFPKDSSVKSYAALNASPSGEAMPVGDLPGWHQVFTDDFTTDVPLGGFSGCNSNTGICSGLPTNVQSQWFAYPDGWKDTSKNGTYSPSKVISINNGMMNLHLHTENGVHMVSAPLPKIADAPGSGGGLLYGRYAVRFRADAVAGYKTAWLLWPDSELWPNDGEIDFPEGDLDGTIAAYMHYAQASGGQDAFEGSNATYPTWHTAITEWSPGKVSFYLDGVLIGTSTTKVPTKPMHWILQTETSLNSVPSNAAAGNVQIDWVAAYSYCPTCTGAAGTPTPTASANPTLTASPTPTTVQLPTVTPTPVASGIISGNIYQLTNKCGGKALDIKSASTSNGAPAILWTATGNKNQQWKIESVGSYYKMTVQHSGKALDIKSASTSNGAIAIQYPWSSATNQQWSFTNLGSGYYKITNRKSNKVLEGATTSTADAVPVDQRTWTGACNQQWKLQ